MKELNKLGLIKGTFISPFSIVVSIGLIGLGISVSKRMINKFSSRLLLK